MAIYKQLQTSGTEEEKRKQGLAGAGSQNNGAPAQQSVSAPQQTQSQPGTAQRSAQTPDYSRYAYDPGMDAAYQQALQALQQAQQQMPTYKGTYDQQLEDVYQQIVGRDKFSYDINGDALYQQYADQYTQRGQMAMMDTMGQAAALTGGYGNSYAQNVGQQAYQAYLQQLNDVVPELYGMALDQYNREGDMLMQQYGMLGDLADKEYGRYQDDLAQYWQQLAFQKQQADDAYNRGYENWYTAYQNQYQAGRDQIADQRYQQEFEYQQGRDQAADQKWQQEYDYQVGRDQVADQQWKDAFEYQQGRDQVSDAQWQQQFDEAQRQYDEQFQYQQGRDEVADKQWQDAFDYQVGRDQVSDERYDKEFQYQQDRDKVSDQQWQDAFNYQQGRDQVSDEQWQAQFDESKRQYDQEYEFALKQYTDAQGGTGGTSSGGGDYPGGGNSAPYGVYSEETAELQKQLNELGANLEVDGIRGPLTDEAYEKYMGSITADVSDSVKDKVADFTTNEDLANYLDSLVVGGVITESQADSLFAENRQPDLVSFDKRTWTLVDDGGVNWMGGIDRNATVKDQYGNTFKLSKLVDALVSEGMTKADAKAYVKNLQAKLGA